MSDKFLICGRFSNFRPDQILHFCTHRHTHTRATIQFNKKKNRKEIKNKSKKWICLFEKKKWLNWFEFLFHLFTDGDKYECTYAFYFYIYTHIHRLFLSFSLCLSLAHPLLGLSLPIFQSNQLHEVFVILYSI